MRWFGRIYLVVSVACAFIGAGCSPAPADRPVWIGQTDRKPVTSDDFFKRGHRFLALKKDYRSAIKDFSRALRLDPNDAWVWYYRGAAYAEMGKQQRTVRDWKKAIELDWRTIIFVFPHRGQYPSVDAQLDSVMRTVALDHLNDLDEVSGCQVGWGMGPREFCTILHILADYLPTEEFICMLDHENPAVRAMGLIHLARQDIVRYQAAIESFHDDEARVSYCSFGDTSGSISLAELAEHILDDPDLLRHWTPKERH